ncbi:FAD/FMN-containing protein [Melanomma pulvis-pyrius CBS 109.77]|uniref:FAD/FMN-containing protein n=1 Tax=Melanomma pulvis-pyrius CBS 109.77 TaxID=1314802 RepID=A0A6A6XSE8_9PLEO|nr:FAD/FMN-containing protein [Melanomma pulvis-pyrius CBS 109.77]
MYTALALIILFRPIAAIVERSASPNFCKCSVHTHCWPNAQVWDEFNTSVSGQLIKTQPLAIPCYPGPQRDEALCAIIGAQWSSATFQSDSPVGLSYPVNLSCPPINVTAGEKPKVCSLGTSPVYAVNATIPEHVASAVNFARGHNIRLVIKTTGHDSLARSEGTGSLEIWLRHLRTGIKYQEFFLSSHDCHETRWTSSTFTIGGGYTWTDVIPEARARNLVVVTGGTPSVSSIGGWMQGGGHGPASRQFGLGADQVLEAIVVLADGSIVTASPCQNPDLFFAIRGGGPGTYGVLVSATIKAWPMLHVAVQHLTISSLTNDSAPLIDAVSILFNAFPDLNDAGYAGYGSWSLASGYGGQLYMFNQTVQYAKNAFDTTLRALSPYNGTALNISISYGSYPDYWTFYTSESGYEPPVGTSGGGLGSRLFDRASVQNITALREMIGIVTGTPKEMAFNNVELVSGGHVFADAHDPYSGVNPAWRRSYFSNIVSRAWDKDTPKAIKAAIQHDITFVKTGAMKMLSPNTGAYMNEADRLDPEFERNFYGSNYERLARIKVKRDSKSVFYCPTCVGSREWEDDSEGRLCRRRERSL